MDSSIRRLLTLTQNADFAHQAKEYMLQAFQQIKSTSGKLVSSDMPQPFGHDLIVLCAEAAYKLGEWDISCQCLSLFFNRSPPTDQFLCRAYICQAQLNAPAAPENLDQFDRSVAHLFKAIDIAKGNPRYHFLVFNISVIFWNLCRPFVKPNFQRLLVNPLSAIVKALDNIEDADFEWRAELKIVLIESYFDANRNTEATQDLAAAVDFVQKHAPRFGKRLLDLMIAHELNEYAENFTKEFPELGFYYRIDVLKRAIKSNAVENNLVEEMNRLVDDLSAGELNPVPPGVEQPKSSCSGYVRCRVKVKRQEKDENTMKPHLLLELGRLAADCSQSDVVKRCLSSIKDYSGAVKDPCLFCEVEFLKSQLLVINLGPDCESYHKSAVNVRLEAVRQCNEALLNAIRLGNADVIQAGCMTQWNLCLPLLQKNLRKHVKRPLTLVAEALENLQSLLCELRCLVHTELAKCEEDEEHLGVAIEHVKKALKLDEGHIYREGLGVFLHRLQMCTLLYEQPCRNEDVAAMIIEQARTTNTGTIRMKRSLLVKAGQALAPEEFIEILDSEGDAKDLSSIRDLEILLKELSQRAKTFLHCFQKAEDHLKRLGNKNDKERAHLWADLAKVARRQEVWDVCRVAARFCLLYDDGRWEADLQKSNRLQESRVQENEGEASLPSANALSLEEKSDQREKTEDESFLYERNLVRLLAEVRFISGEAVMHQLRMEGAELCDIPVAPVDTRKRPKGFQRIKAEDHPDWITYADWIKSLSGFALLHFVRGAEIGAKLNEPWLICNGASYVWNYSNHIMLQHRNHEIVSSLQTIVDLFKNSGYGGETSLVVRFCNALALGYIQPWLTSSQPAKNDDNVPRPPSPTEKSPKSPKKAKSVPAKQKQSNNFLMPLEATPGLKSALEVCEYGLNMTNGSSPSDVIPIGIRFPLLQTWVRVKHWLLSSVGKALGVADEMSTEGQDPMTRCVVAVELLCNERKSDFKDSALLQVPQVVELMESATWTDSLVELHMWTLLGQSALAANDHANVDHCFQKSLLLAPEFEANQCNSHAYIVSQELLGYSSAIYGESLLQNTHSRSVGVRSALQHLVQSARFGQNARNPEIVISAAKHFWNGILPLINDPTERELLREPLSVLLQCITETIDQKRYRVSSKSDESGDGTVQTSGEKSAIHDDAVKKLENESLAKELDEELSIRAALYSVFFRSFADKCDWEGGFRAMEAAVKDLPRTNHRMVLFKHLVVAKARLGIDVTSTMQRFKGLPEDYVAGIWREVALSSNKTLQQLEAYQNAIELLVSSESDWLKVEYLLEFAEWLYCNELRLDDCRDQLEWAIDILMNIKTETGQIGIILSKGKSERETPLPTGRTTPSQSGKSEKQKKTENKKQKPTGDRSKEKTSDKKLKVDPTESRELNPEPSHRDEKDRNPNESLDKSVGTKETDAVKVIPTETETEIGVLPKNPALLLKDILNVRQLEGIFRAHVLLAKISGPGCEQYLDQCLMAYGAVMQIWMASVGLSGVMMKEIGRLLAPEEPSRKGSPKRKKDAEESGKNSPKKKKQDADEGSQKQNKQSKESSRSSSKKRKKDVDESTKDKPKKRIPIDELPSDIDEWSTYEVPDEVLEAFRHQLMGASSVGISGQTMPQPTLTIWYLDLLVTMLRDLGFSHLSLPVVVLAETVAKNTTSLPSLFNLFHLQAMEICQELNLANGVLYRQKQIQFCINEDDQSKGHEEMMVWRDKQSKLVLSEDDNCAPKRGSSQTSNEVKSIGESEKHLSPEIREIRLCDVWLKTAELMIKNSIYKSANELLNEARTMAVTFDDRRALGHSLLQLGKLSYAEAQYKQAYILSQQAQDVYNGDEMFWYETVVLACDSIESDEDIKAKDRFSRVKSTLDQTISVFTELKCQRPNKSPIISYILVQLKYRMASMKARVAMATCPANQQTKMIVDLLDVELAMEVVCNQLLDLGHRREAGTVMRHQALILSELAKRECVPEMKHGYYIQAAKILNEAVIAVESIYADVLALSPSSDSTGLSLPVQRQCVQMKLSYAKVLLEMLEIHAREEIKETTRIHQQDHVTRMLGELARETPDLTSMENEWQLMTRTLGDEILCQLTSAHGLSGAIPYLKAKTLYLIGKCLRLLSLVTSVNPPIQWNVTAVLDAKSPLSGVAVDVTRGSPDATSDRLAVGRSNVNQEDAEVFANHSPMMAKYLVDYNSSTQLLFQATECLQQAINLSLEKEYKKIVGNASLELVECIGQFDPGLSSQYLALYQSCQASEYLRGLTRKALKDPTLSQTAALFRQLDCCLTSCGVRCNAKAGPMFKAIIRSLDENSLAWNRLAILPHHLDFSKEFPPTFVFVVLQHSPDRSFLYGTVLDKSTPLASNLKALKSGVAPTQMASSARTIRADTSPEGLDYLVCKWREFKKDLMQSLLKQEFKRTARAQQDKLLFNLNESSIPPHPHPPPSLPVEPPVPDEDDCGMDACLHGRFFQLLLELEEYLRPVTMELETYFRPAKPSGGSKPGPKAMPEEAASASECVLILADQHLLELPLEALELFRSNNIDSISRDISLQMFYHRYHVDDTDADAEDPKGAKKGKKSPKSQKKAASKAPSTKDAAAKSGVADGTLPTGCQTIDASSFKYIVDPHLDCSEIETKQPLAVFNQMRGTFGSYTGRWTGISGDSEVPSVGQLEDLLLDGGAFIFYGMERFLAYLPPHKAVTLNLVDNSLILLMDQSQTSSSFTRQSKLDCIKSEWQLLLESPVETAMLLSLAGGRCCIVNQWQSSVCENGVKFESLISDLFGKGRTTGQAIRRLIDFRFREKEEEEERRRKEQEEEEAASAKAAKNKKKQGERPESGKKKSGKSESPRSDSGKKQKGGKAESPGRKESPERTKQKPKSPELVESPQTMEATEDSTSSPVPGGYGEVLPTVSRLSCSIACYGLPNYVVIPPGKR